LPKPSSKEEKEEEKEEGGKYGLNSHNYLCRPMVSNLLAADTPWGGGAQVYSMGSSNSQSTRRIFLRQPALGFLVSCVIISVVHKM
jgi:hypothetical protein